MCPEMSKNAVIYSLSFVKLSTVQFKSPFQKKKTAFGESKLLREMVAKGQKKIKVGLFPLNCQNPYSNLNYAIGCFYSFVKLSRDESQYCLFGPMRNLRLAEGFWQFS